MPYKLEQTKRPKPDEEDKLSQVNTQLTSLQNWRLTQLALTRGVSKGSLMRQIIQDFLDQEDYKSGVKKRPWDSA